jgi:hypothetical protein
MPLSKEYEEFLQDFKFRKGSLYEKICGVSEIILPINPPQREKFEKAIDFAHLDITPKGTFGFSVLFLILFPLFFLSLGYLFNILTSIPYILLVIIFSITIFWYIYTLPFTIATAFRIKASSEMVLAVLYMSIAMKVIPNLEYAIKFSASNLTGPLGRDIKKILWDVYTGKFVSVSDALDPFMEKWKRENEEFVKAIYLIKNSFFETREKRNKVLNEAVNVILNGTKDRMRNYARELKAPLTVLNALGILLPMVGLVFFPIISIFLPDMIQPAFLVIGYDVLLPIVIYWMMKTYLEKRPTAFHQPELSKHPHFAQDKMRYLILILSVLIPAAVIYYAYSILAASTETFSFNLLLYSMAVTWALSAGIVSYTIFTTVNKLKTRDEIIQIESELGEVLFQLGTQLTRGMPIENALKEALPRLKELKIAKMVEKILYNMENFSMNFNSAVFDENGGAIKYFPSRLINAVMHAVTEISKGGALVLSDAMLSISAYLKNMHDVEEELKTNLDEVSSEMQMQGLILSPLSSGIVVSLVAMVTQVLVMLKGATDKLKDQLTGYGPLGSAGGGVLDSIINLNKITPAHTFQLIVGLYMIEAVTMIAYFRSVINFGDDPIQKKYSIGKLLLYGTIIYSIVLLVIYSAFTSLIPISSMVKQ